jgi:polyferredoxin
MVALRRLPPVRSETGALYSCKEELSVAHGTEVAGSGWRGRLEGVFGPKTRKTYWLRLVVQVAFALFLLYLGVAFARFVHALQAGVTPLPPRPAGAEAFLPISGLMGALDWVYQGRLNAIHPAATVLFLLFTLMALLLRKAFCAWICPIGLLSEMLGRLGRRLFGRNFLPPKWLDIPLRSLKYLLFGFFAWAIAQMSAEVLQGFIEAPYNRVSDVKMYLFFAELSTTAAVVLLLLALASVLVQGFWCRYLCPYGAWLGLFSWASPVRIRRDAGVCIDCGLCDQACMARLPISRKGRIVSAECTGCLDCVATCPVSTSLTVAGGRWRLRASVFAAAVLLLFFAGYGVARWSGYWQGGTTEAEYLELYPVIDTLEHIR